MERPPQNNNSSKAADSEEDEELSSDGKPVGYKRPPARTRFKKGRSGNPKGRPKGSESMSKLLHEVLAERVSVTQNGKVIRMNKAEALVQLTMARAIKGDTKAMDGMLAFADKMGRLDEPKEEDGENTPGMVLVPEQIPDDEEWERLYGADARGEKHLNHDQPQPRKVTKPFSIAAGDALVRERKPDEALACYHRNLAMCQAVIARDGASAEAQKNLRIVIARLVFIGLDFIWTGQYRNAISLLDQAIDLEPTEMRWHRFRALALMLDGNVSRARAIYLEHRDNEEWKAGTLKDFEGAREGWLQHPLMDEIEKLFAANSDEQPD
jgi:tetratricopeptide (TPR) repeat protein